MLKPWILHVVLAWKVTVLSPEEQKTILLQFDSGADCKSIAVQVDQQVRSAKAAFYLKSITCYPCHVLAGKARCPRPSVAKKKK